MLRPKAIREIERPVTDIESLLYTKGEVLSLALIVRPLANSEDIPAERGIEAEGIAEIGVEIAAVSVHENKGALCFFDLQQFREPCSSAEPFKDR